MDGVLFNQEKTFKNDLIFFLNKIKNNEYFSLSRWGDGELMIIEKEFIDLTNIKNGEFKFDPNDEKYNNVSENLIKSFKYVNDNYYVGIACRCCVGDEKHNYMKKLSNQPETNLTWANIFVNSNYNFFIENYLKEFTKKDIIMVVNKKCDISKLPFKVEDVYYVGVDAWLNDYIIIDEIKKKYKNEANKIFLFAAGPLANIMCYELWNDMNKNNIYIDIGSTLDVIMGMKPTRGYLRGANTLKKECIW